MERNSIHRFERTLKRTRERIEESKLVKSNKRCLLEFEKLCVAEGLSAARRLKLLNILYIYSTRFFKTPYSRATEKTIWNSVLEIESSDYAPWTKHDFKVAIKKLFKFVEWGSDALRRKDYPESVAGIRTRVKKKDQVRIQAGDILTENEVNQFVESANGTQEKAFFSLMYELGARVSEIGTMRIKNVSRDKYSYICDVNGKTGPRSARIVFSAGRLTAWLNIHPKRNNPDSFLWGAMKNGGWKPPSYSTIQGAVKKVAKHAGIEKRVHPHLFRHTRITHVLANGKMNESQAKRYFGLTADSEVLGTYSHLVSKDANDAVLKMYGITIDEKKKTTAPPKCGMCGDFNEKRSKYCNKCGYVLNDQVPLDADSRMKSAGDMVSRFLSEPEIEQAFRRMVREEIGKALSQFPPERWLPPSEPKAARGRGFSVTIPTTLTDSGNQHTSNHVVRANP